MEAALIKYFYKDYERLTNEYYKTSPYTSKKSNLSRAIQRDALKLRFHKQYHCLIMLYRTIPLIMNTSMIENINYNNNIFCNCKISDNYKSVPTPKIHQRFLFQYFFIIKKIK